jgi:hypothetical protein
MHPELNSILLYSHTDLNKVGWPSQQSENKKIAERLLLVVSMFHVPSQELVKL